MFKYAYKMVKLIKFVVLITYLMLKTAQVPSYPIYYLFG